LKGRAVQDRLIVAGTVGRAGSSGNSQQIFFLYSLGPLLDPLAKSSGYAVRLPCRRAGLGLSEERC